MELGRNILVASDQWGFIVDHQVIERQRVVCLDAYYIDKYEVTNDQYKNLLKRLDIVYHVVGMTQGSIVPICLLWTLRGMMPSNMQNGRGSD